MAFAVGFAIAVLAACGSDPAPGTGTPTGNVATDVVVVMEASSFKPASISLSAGKPTTIEIRNDDSVPHDFAIEALELKTGTIAPGKRVTRTVVASRTVHEFTCTFHPEMKGRIEVL